MYLIVTMDDGTSVEKTLEEVLRAIVDRVIGRGQVTIGVDPSGKM